MKLTANSYFLEVVCKCTLPAAPVLVESVLSGGYLDLPLWLVSRFSGKNKTCPL